MVTLLSPSRIKTEMGYQEPHSTHTDGLLVKIARDIEVFLDELSGLPMTDKDRVDVEVARGHDITAGLVHF